MSNDDLIKRLADGNGSDVAINIELAGMVGQPLTTFPQYEPDGVCPNYTGNLDDALSLVEKLLPGWGKQVGHPLDPIAGGVGGETGWYASVFTGLSRNGNRIEFTQSPVRPTEEGYKYASSASRAILIALIRALDSIKKEEKE